MISEDPDGRAAIRVQSHVPCSNFEEERGDQVGPFQAPCEEFVAVLDPACLLGQSAERWKEPNYQFPHGGTQPGLFAYPWDGDGYLF